MKQKLEIEPVLIEENKIEINNNPDDKLDHKKNEVSNELKYAKKKSRPLSFSEKSEDLSKITSKSVNKIISPLKRSNQNSVKRGSLKEESKDDILNSINQIFSDKNSVYINKGNDMSYASKKSVEKTPTKSPERAKPYKLSNRSSPLKMYSSIDSLSSVTLYKDISKDVSNLKSEKNETIYDKFYKIANKPRPELSPDKEENKKKSPTRTAEQLNSNLYDDALRRASIHYESTEYTEVCTSLKSQQVIANKFIKEFLENLEKLEISSDKIDMLAMISLLKAFNFIKNEPEVNIPEKENPLLLKFWNHFDCETIVSKEKFLTSCLSVLGIFPSQILIDPEFEFSECFKLEDLQKYFNCEEELRIHKKFYSFYENRQILVKPIRVFPQVEYPFKPQLSAETESLAKKRKDEMGDIGSEKRLEFFMQEKQKAVEKSEKAKLEKEQEELKKCTFKPKIIEKKKPKENITMQEHRTLALYEQSKQSKQKPIKSSQEIELEKNLSECTFAPNIHRVKFKEETNGLYTLSVQKNILRLQKAREEEARKKLILDGMGHSKSLSVDFDCYKRPKSPPKPSVPRLSRSPERVMPMIDLANFGNVYDTEIKEIAEENEPGNSEKNIINK